MPRSVRDSDDDTEAKLGRRNRLLPDNSVLNSPVRRSSRLKQPKKQSGLSPDSPSSDTSTRTTRRRAGTLDSTAADSHRSLRSRKISDGSDVSEQADMESATTQKRSTRRSLTAASSVDATKPSTRLSRHFVRAGSETKSPAPTRTTRRTRASSVDPESINPKYIEESSTPTKVMRTRGRASMLHLEPCVKEEGEDNDSSISVDVDAIQDRNASESGSSNVSPSLSTSGKPELIRSGRSSKNASLNKLNMEKIDEQDSSGNNTLDGSKVSIDTGSGTVGELTSKPESQETIEYADDRQMEFTHTSPMKPLHNVSTRESETSDARDETLVGKSVDKQQSSPSNKENEDINVHDRSLGKQNSELVIKLTAVKDDVIRNLSSHEEYCKKDAFEVDGNVNVNTEIEKNPSNSNGSITIVKATDAQKGKLESVDYMYETKKSPVKKRLLYWESDQTIALDEEESDDKISKNTIQPEINIRNEEGDITESSHKDERQVGTSEEVTESTGTEKTTKDLEQESLSTDESKPVNPKVEGLKSVTKSPQVKESPISESTASEINRGASYVDEKMDIDESIVEDEETESTVKDASFTLEGDELSSSLLLKVNNDSCVLNICNKNSKDTAVNENKVDDKEDDNQTEEDFQLYVSDETRNTVESSSDIQHANADVFSENLDDVNNDTFTKFATETMEREILTEGTSVKNPNEKTVEIEKKRQTPVKHDDVSEPMEMSDLPEDKTINNSVKPATESLTGECSENELQDTLNKSTDSLPRSSVNSVTDVTVRTKENENDLLDTVENIEPSIVTGSERPEEVTEEKEVRKRLSSGDLKTSRKNSIAADEEMSNHEDGSEVDKNERPECNADHSDSDMNIGSLFKDIPAEEWDTEQILQSRPSSVHSTNTESRASSVHSANTESRPSSVHSANTEKAENDSEAECDLVLVDKNAWQAAEKIREMKSSQDLEYDSDDTVELKALADSMHEPADQEDEEVDNASETSVQDVNSSRRKSVDSKKLNSSRSKSLNESVKKSEDANATEMNSSKKRKSLLDSGKKSSSIRNVSTVESTAEKHLNEDVNSPVSQKDLLDRRKSLNSSLIQSSVSRITKKVTMEATSTPLKDKANLGMGSFGNITLFRKQGESSIHETSLKTSKLKSGLVDEDESGSDTVNVSGKKKRQSQCVSSDDEGEEDEVKTDKSSGRKNKKPESPAKNTSNKKNANVNYSKVVEVDSSESNSDLESDNSDWRNESRKIPRFLFTQAGDTSHDDEEEQSDEKSIDSDIEREYNLGGKSNLEYSDDNVPGDDCRPSETESSDSEDEGDDLKDFIVDDDEVEDESEEEESDDEKVAGEEAEEAENEKVEEIETEAVEEALNEVVEEIENEKDEEAEMAEINEMETEEIEKAESPDVKETENEEIEKAEELEEAESKEATDAKVETGNKQKDEDKIKIPCIVEENIETKIVPSENSGTMKFNVINISSPRSSPKLVTKPTNSWHVDEDVKIAADKTSRELISSPFDLMKKKRKRSGSDTPDLRFRKMKRMESTQDILIEEEKIDQVEAEGKSTLSQRIEGKKLLVGEDMENEAVTAEKVQKKTTKRKEISDIPQAKVSKTKKNDADLAKVEKSPQKQHQRADETNLIPEIARSKQQTADHPETAVKSKKRKVQFEKVEEDVTSEANVNKKQLKKANENDVKSVNNRVSKKPQFEILSDSDEAPDVVAFAKAKEEALRAIKETTESIKIRKELLKKKQTNHLEKMRQEREQKQRKAHRMELVRADRSEKTLKRLPSDVLENLPDVPRPRKKQKMSKKSLNTKDVLPSRSMHAPHVKVDENFITLSSASGSTTQFNIVNLQKVEKRGKKSAAIASFRQKMLARNSRQPVSTYLAYLRKQKASGKDKQRGKPF